MANRFLSCKDVSELSGKTLKTVWHWIRTGQLKATRPGGKCYVILESDFIDFMKSGTTATKGE